MNHSVFRSEEGQWLWMVALLVLVVLAGNAKLLRGKVAPQWDAVSFFAPEFSLVADHAKAGQLLLWDPWIAAGAPDLAEPELGATSPLMMLVGVAFPSPLTGFLAYWMIIWIGAGVGMLLFARYLGASACGGSIAACGFVASGFFVGHAQHTSSLLSVAFLPWICWRFDDFLISRRYWSAVQAGVLYGLSALGGYPQFTILTPGFLALWAVGRILFADRKVSGSVITSGLVKERLLAVMVGMVLVGLVGGLIFCPPYASILRETRGYSDRVGERLRVDAIGSNVLPAGAIATLASPYLFLLNYRLPGQLWPFTDISMSNIYCGAAVAVLSIVALLSQSRWRLWMAAIALLFLCCSVGSQLPLRGWMYDYLLPTRYFRGPSMFSAYSIFLLCVLAALASKDLGEDAEDGGKLASRFLATAGCAAVIAILVFWAIVHRAPLRPFRPVRAVEHLAVVWGALVWIALLFFLHRLRRRRCTQMLAAVAALDACLSIVIAGPAMYSADTLPWWKAMSAQHVVSLDLSPNAFERQLFPPQELMYDSVVNNRNLPLKVASLDNYVPLSNRFQLASVADPTLREFALGNNRIWFSDQEFVLPPTDVSFVAYSAVAHSSGIPPLVLHTTAQMRDAAGAHQRSPDDRQAAEFLRSAKPLVPASVTLLTYLPNTLRFKYVAPRNGWLLVTDRWAPGWSAMVNNVPAEVMGGNFIFRAVRVREGENTVRFDYKPRGYIAMVILSWGVLLFFVVCEGWRLLRRKQSRTKALTSQIPGGPGLRL